MAEATLAKGDRIVATARKADDRIKDLEERFPKMARFVELDITVPEQVKLAVQAAIDAFGRVDVLVNNAGSTLVGAIEEFSDVQIRRLFETNFFGMLNMTRAFLPVFRQQRSGYILNISSISGQVGTPGAAIYSATKFAIAGLSEALVQEVAPFGIKVTIIEPGTFRTNLVARIDRAEPIEAYDHIHQFLNNQEEQLTYGDPAEAVQAWIKAVKSTNPPLHLPVGRDSLNQIRQKLESEMKEFEKWESVSVSAKQSE